MILKSQQNRIELVTRPAKSFQGLLSEIADFVGTVTRCGEGLEDPKCSPKTNEEIASVTLKMFRVLKKLVEVGNSDQSIHIVLDSLIELTSEKRTPKQVWSLKECCVWSDKPNIEESAFIKISFASECLK